MGFKICLDYLSSLTPHLQEPIMYEPVLIQSVLILILTMHFPNSVPSHPVSSVQCTFDLGFWGPSPTYKPSQVTTAPSYFCHQWALPPGDSHKRWRLVCDICHIFPSWVICVCLPALLGGKFLEGKACLLFLYHSLHDIQKYTQHIEGYSLNVLHKWGLGHVLRWSPEANLAISDQRSQVFLTLEELMTAESLGHWYRTS